MTSYFECKKKCRVMYKSTSTELIKTFHVQHIVSRAEYMQGMQEYWEMFYFHSITWMSSTPNRCDDSMLFVSFVCRYSTNWVCHPSPIKTDRKHRLCIDAEGVGHGTLIQHMIKDFFVEDFKLSLPSMMLILYLGKCTM